MKRIAAVLSATLLLILGLNPAAQAVLSPDGLSYSSAGARQCATIAGSGLFHRIFVQSCTSGQTNQHWALYYRGGSDIFELRNDVTGWCMEVDQASKADGAPVQAAPCDINKRSQSWHVNYNQPGPRRYVADHSGKCLAYNPRGSVFTYQSTCTSETVWEQLPN